LFIPRLFLAHHGVITDDFRSKIDNRQSTIGNEGHVTDPSEQFERLEEKLLRAIELFKRTQTEKRTLEEEVEKLKVESKERAQALNAMERELIALRREREDVRSRVEKLLARIDGLTSSDSEG
jgi:FtsZ-binding cell division protein ZapB